MFEKKILFAGLIAYAVSIYWDMLSRSLSARLTRFRYRKHLNELAKPHADEQQRNIVIIGAAFAGYHAARLLAASLPPDGRYKIVVVEPNSHFNFTWVLPRFCVVEGHEHKAFIPYGHYFKGLVSEKYVRWVRDSVASMGRSSVRLRDSGEEVPYEYLIIATGSGQGAQLPSRVGSEDKAEGTKLLRGVQSRIASAKKVVVVGGGAAGVELAADTKAKYPEKTIVLVHSRQAVMHRFGKELQEAALNGLEELGVEVILGERVMDEETENGVLTLASGRKVDCDYMLNCTGQQPASGLFAELSPNTISETGHIRVKPTLQVADDSLPNVYACGDVAHTGTQNPNARSATKQAMVAADNIILAVQGKQPRHVYKPYWADGIIQLTLGLVKSVIHYHDGKTGLLFTTKEEGVDLMAERAWTNMGAEPFVDGSEPEGSMDIMLKN
ncbi:hypothetical protein AJ80_05536 [Polytolypa hystricis UAMH7299]|uniref:FAD/NAD(P)-binding domain-containing protein n=1 Tax=Polytolypa hystricis (strain UAMH7299) TaxID=1447883 RepID=A0A2B7Y305_POLH7|nr:hypothetical protein AJ80_05536 [Polytolypa hystricis UAMH7299]